MTTIGEDDPLIRSLRIPDVTSYLRRAGWNPTESRYSGLLAFQSQIQGAPGPVLVALNRDPSYPDTYRRIADVVNTLSQVEERPPDEIARAIAAVDADVMLWRLPEDQTAGASVSLDLAVHWVQRLRDVVAYAACAEQDPRPYFVKATGIGTQHVRHCRFGHTVPGSFAFRVESPLPPYTARVQPVLDPILETAPFPRRVVERITRGLLIVRDAVLSGDPEPLVRGYRLGLNANLCETLREMLEATGDSGLACDVRWSRSWQPSPELSEPTPIRLEYRAAQFLDAGSRGLRQPERAQARPIRGRVVQLRAEGELESEEFEPDQVSEEGPTITVLASTDDLRTLRVRVSLPVAEYRQACDAHRDGREVEVSGRLEKLGKFWTLSGARDFRVL